ncbi:MAG: glycoside hydrolase family 3 C-terminal domain-containing protein, partial [Alphaproteobacteria bacterium]|nr:glycoside hydrolase family 3 C-terminal domain-containing protein [Alphaproteobacteria bacterium]
MMISGKTRVLGTLALLLCSTAALADDDASASSRAAATVAKMTTDEQTILTHGIMPMALGDFGSGGPKFPDDAVPGAGYIYGIPRLNVPSLRETDASLGVAYIGGLRKDGATALPSGMAMASTWNPALIEAGGAMIGSEAKAKGFNVMLAGGTNLMRDPRNGRTFEYMGEDPLLAGTLAGAAIRGIQSNHIISTTKHFALNDYETARDFANIIVSDKNARESDLLAFEIAIEQGKPGSVMCAYNKINDHYACDNDYTLNKVLKGDWGWKGFVMSDWGAVHSPTTALNGLDQQSAWILDGKDYLGKILAENAAKDPAYAARVKDMNQRVLYAIYANKLDSDPAMKGGAIDFEAHGAVAQKVAEQGIVLLRNEGNILPLAASAKRITVIGGYADSGVLSGGGSSQVEGPGGPAVAIPLGGDGAFALFFSQAYQRSSPLKAMKALAPDTKFSFTRGDYITDAVIAAKKADVVVIFATQWSTEGVDLPDLSLPHGQDALIDAVASANPHTIVVLENGSPVLMPWLNKTAAVLESWFPGARGGQAIANILYGKVNPSGHLPGSFPASLDQLPRPALPGAETIEPDFQGKAHPGEALTIDYNIEGADIGYRWYARNHTKPLFPFGFGLSYTSFALSGLKVDAHNMTASFTVANTGSVAGDDVAQVYLTSAAGTAHERLVGFQRVSLAPGTKQSVTVKIDPRLLAEWNGTGWTVRGGQYSFALGTSAADLQPAIS